MIKEVAPPLVAAVALFAGGCGGDHQPTTAVQTAGIEQTQPAPTVTERDPATQAYLDSLNRFRRRILEKHKARILLSACVAWPNSVGGLTVTLNPGVATAEVARQKVDYYIFSVQDESAPLPAWPMNGPSLNDGQAMTLVFQPEEKIKGGLDRTLSKAAVHQDGQVYYRDTQTGEPVIDTKLTSGPFTPKHVGEVCLSLKHHLLRTNNI